MTAQFESVALEKGAKSQHAQPRVGAGFSPEAYLLAVLVGVAVALCALASFWG